MKSFCLDIYIFEDSSDLENLPLLNIELTLILQFFFPDDLLKLFFFWLDASLFSPQLIKRMRNKNQLIKYFWRLLLRRKNCLYVKFIHTIDSRWFQYLKTWSFLNHTIFINYLQSKTNLWAKLAKNHIQ